MPASKEVLINELRYAERLCLRTARFYRRLQTAATFLTVVGGSAVFATLAPQLPAWLSIVGAAVFATFGAVMVAVRPGEKATANDADARRYAQLRTAAADMEVGALQTALNKARETDTAEIEPLRDVAWNDVVREVGHPEMAVTLTAHQKLLAALA